MRTLHFTAEGQRLSRTDSWRPVAGSSGYLRCEFELGPEWEGLDVTARFSAPGGAYAEVPLSDGACDVPDEVAQGSFWRVSLSGEGGGSVPTNQVTVFQSPGAGAGPAAQPKPPLEFADDDDIDSIF